MLKSNSKKALENLHNYIREYCEYYLVNDYGIDPQEIKTKNGLYRAIYNIFREEMQPQRPYYRRHPESTCFMDWAQGLAMGGLFCYWYNREAAADVAQLLEETAEDVANYKNKFSRKEEAAEEFLTLYIYREVSKAARA